MDLMEIIKSGTKPRLHLGCGNYHFDDYINIDYPLEEHTLTHEDKADIHADITELVLPSNSVAEVRSHHLFEHFTRAKALRLLIDWYDWLIEGGKLVIETPDFESCIRRIVSRRCTFEQRMRLIRHIFGSHEAYWALHLDAWDEKKFKHVLPRLGYRNLSFHKNEYLGIFNIEVEAYKQPPFMSIGEQQQKAKEILELSLVARVPSEMEMLDIWYKEILEK
jgi:hypothetical protein